MNNMNEGDFGNLDFTGVSPEAKIASHLDIPMEHDAFCGEAESMIAVGDQGLIQKTLLRFYELQQERPSRLTPEQMEDIGSGIAKLRNSLH